MSSTSVVLFSFFSVEPSSRHHLTRPMDGEDIQRLAFFLKKVWRVGEVWAHKKVENKGIVVLFLFLVQRRGFAK